MMRTLGKDIQVIFGFKSNLHLSVTVGIHIQALCTGRGSQKRPVCI